LACNISAYACARKFGTIIRHGKADIKTSMTLPATYIIIGQFDNATKKVKRGNILILLDWHTCTQPYMIYRSTPNLSS
jgi:hypothetical protein